MKIGRYWEECGDWSAGHRCFYSPTPPRSTTAPGMGNSRIHRTSHVVQAISLVQGGKRWDETFDMRWSEGDSRAYSLPTIEVVGYNLLPNGMTRLDHFTIFFVTAFVHSQFFRLPLEVVFGNGGLDPPILNMLLFSINALAGAAMPWSNVRWHRPKKWGWPWMVNQWNRKTYH